MEIVTLEDKAPLPQFNVMEEDLLVYFSPVSPQSSTPDYFFAP